MSTKDITVFVYTSVHIFDILHHLGCISLKKSSYPSNKKCIPRKSTRIGQELPYLFSLKYCLSKI